jgi:hypothetical protein
MVVSLVDATENSRNAVIELSIFTYIFRRGPCYNVALTCWGGETEMKVGRSTKPAEKIIRVRELIIFFTVSNAFF